MRLLKWPKKKVVQNRQGTTDFSDVVAAVKEEVEAKKEVSNENKNNYEPNLLTYKQKNANL